MPMTMIQISVVCTSDRGLTPNQITKSLSFKNQKIKFIMEKILLNSFGGWGRTTCITDGETVETWFDGTGWDGE